MYIKSNVMISSIVIFSASLQSASELNADIRVGMQTNAYEFPAAELNINNDGKMLSYPKRHKGCDLLALSFGLERPEFVNLSMSYDYLAYELISIAPYVDLSIFDYRADVGVMISATTPLYDSDVLAKGYVNIHRGLFFNDINYASSVHLDFDIGIETSFALTDYASVFMNIRQPLMTDYTVSVEEQDTQVRSRPNLSMGLTFALLGEFGDLKDDMGEKIIQEPISIPVVNLVVEEPSVESVPAYPASTEVVQEEEPMGWFAWIIEMIARLFRF